MGWELAGKAVLVTGGASGIGLACVRAFRAEGARVGVIDREAGPWGGATDGGSQPVPADRSPGLVAGAADRGSEPAPAGRSSGSVAGSAGMADSGSEPGLEFARADVASDPAGPGLAFARADVTDEPAFAAAVATLARHLGGLDVVVGCAGVSGPVGKPLAETTAAEVAAVLAVNVTGPFLLVKHALPHLADGGSVVLLGSDSAFTAAPGMVPYCASKGAVVALTRALSVEVAGIRVNCVCPSVVDTPMARGDLGDLLDDPAFPVQAAEDVARQVLFLASPASRPVNGQALLADFGMSARSAFPA